MQNFIWSRKVKFWFSAILCFSLLSFVGFPLPGWSFELWTVRRSRSIWSRVFFFFFCDTGECLRLHNLRLPELLGPLLRQKLPPCGLLRQPWPAHGDEPVAAAAPAGPPASVPASGRRVTTSKGDWLGVNSLSRNVSSPLRTRRNQRRDLFSDSCWRLEVRDGDFNLNLTMFHSVMIQKVPFLLLIYDGKYVCNDSQGLNIWLFANSGLHHHRSRPHCSAIHP